MKSTLILIAVFTLTGCSSHQFRVQSAAFEENARGAKELTEVPFFSQRTDQCGPATIASALQWEGLEVTPDDLTSYMFIAEKGGSLQAEVKATIRRHGLLPYEHKGGIEDLIQQIDDGEPMVVLQNLGLSFAPVWHYALVIGYNTDSDEIILRSGKTKRLATGLRQFERSWRYSGYWGLTLHEPSDVPAGAKEADFIQAAVDLETVGQLQTALAAYQAAVGVWPNNLVALVGRGNIHYRLGKFEQAATAYREAASRHPHNPTAHHNLAWALVKTGRLEEGLTAARDAVSLASTDEKQFHESVKKIAALLRKTR